MSTALSSAPITSVWYGQGGAVDLVRRLESLAPLAPAPGPAGVVTARADDLTVTFVEGLKTPLPQPWQPCGREARITWQDLPTGQAPAPDHPVYLVAFGTTADGALIGLNLAAFSRLRINGDRPTATAVIARWVLELLATHPAISIGLTSDTWSGPWTTRVQPVEPGRVPDVDVLVCGAELTYAERAHVVATARSPIVVDLGDDAAVTTSWSITCGADREGQISRGSSATPMAVTLIVPAPEILERCTQLMIGAGATDDGSTAVETPDDAEILWPTDEPADSSGTGDEPATDTGADAASPPLQHETPAPPVVTRQPAVAADPHPIRDHGPAPIVAPIWNRILGRVTLAPPHPGAQPGPRERRLNELLVYLQLHRRASTDDIIGAVFGGAATEKTVTQQMSLLRKRLGALHIGGPKALPPMTDGTYSLDPVVCSDWMEFDRLVEILIDTTTTANLVAAMDLVTGPALGGIPNKEWPCTRDLREQIRDRIPGAAVVLARRHRDAERFGIAVDIARKGLWYDSVRQDLWETALSSALEGRDKEAFRALRAQFLNTIPGPERDPAVVGLTGRAG